MEAEILTSSGNHKLGIQVLKQAIDLEDDLKFNEPPDWFFSVRHLLGDVLMNTKEYVGAEKIYLEDFTYWPKNGFALNGLYESLMGQNKIQDAEDIKKQFDIAWKYADSELKYSRIEKNQRKDLALKINVNSPNSLIFLAGSFCFGK